MSLRYICGHGPCGRIRNVRRYKNDRIRIKKWIIFKHSDKLTDPIFNSQSVYVVRI